MNQVKAGDVVQLKSGGQKMTVDEVGNDGEVHCVWFDGAEAKSRWFKAEALKLDEA